MVKDYQFRQGDGQPMHGDVVAKDAPAWYVRQGQSYEAATIFDDVASGSAAEVVIRNPAGSGVRAILTLARIAANGASRILVYNGSTINSAGTNLDIENRLTDPSDLTDDEALTVERGATVTVNDANPADAGVLGSGGQRTGSASENGGTVLPPGTNRHYRVLSEAAGVDVSFAFNWHEFSETES